MHQHLPTSMLKIMDATGHCPHLSHPEETIRLITQYLNEASVSVVGSPAGRGVTL